MYRTEPDYSAPPSPPREVAFGLSPERCTLCCREIRCNPFAASRLNRISSVHKTNDELENPLEMMKNSALWLCSECSYFFLTSEPAGWIAGACPTSCSSLTTRGTPFIPRRLMSSSNSRVSSLFLGSTFLTLRKKRSHLVDLISLFSLILSNLHSIFVLSVWDGGIHAVSSASPREHQHPTTLHLHLCFCRSQPRAHWPLWAAPRQTSRGDGNVPRFSNHPLRSSTPSTNLHQGTKILQSVSCLTAFWLSSWNELDFAWQ